MGAGPPATFACFANHVFRSPDHVLICSRWPLRSSSVGQALCWEDAQDSGEPSSAGVQLLG